MSLAKTGKKAVLPTVIFGLLVILAAWLMNRINFHAPGIGGDSDRPAATAPPLAVSAQRAEPIQVVIHEDRYLVSGRELTLRQVVSAATAARSSGPAVKIVSGPDSRMGAQRDLQKALDDAHVLSVLESEPASEP